MSKTFDKIEDTLANSEAERKRAMLAIRLRVISEHAYANIGNQQVMSALADCEATLKRIAARSSTLPEEYERVEFKQTRGPTIEFTGRLLAQSEHNTRRGVNMLMEVWETSGGAFIAMSSGLPIDDNPNAFEDLRVTVVEPSDDIQAMRFAVMDHFNWDLAARSMVSKKLKWSLRQDVD